MTDSLRYQVTTEDHCLVVRPAGTLAADTYAELRDYLLKCVVEQPSAVIVDLAGLTYDGEPLLSVFAAVWLRTCEWPAVPLLLVAEPGALPAKTAVRRYVAVHGTIADALAGVDRPPRRRAHRVLPPSMGSLPPARAFVRKICEDWALTTAVAEKAASVACELVTNTVQHTDSEARLRLELRRGMLTVAVGDDDPAAAVLRDPGAGRRTSGLGLLLVTQMAMTWGCVPDHANRRKVVWAVLRTS